MNQKRETTGYSRWISAVGLAVLLVISAVFSYNNIKPRLAAVPQHTGTSLPTSPVSPADVSSQTETSAKPTEPTQPTAPLEETVKLKYVRITKAVNIRAKDNDTAEKIGTAMKGDELPLVSETQSRYQIKMSNGKIGWIVKSCAELLEKETVIKHLPVYTSGAPIKMNGTQEGDGLRDILKSYGTVGGQVAIIKNGQVAYHYEYGYADKENKKKVTENTKYRIASVTKVFTAMMAMRQVDDGTLDLDEDLSKIMGYKVRHPSFPKQPVTTRMLLTHTAGLVDREKMYGPALKEKLSDPDHYSSQPGKSFLYSNLSMGTAGAVLEKRSGQIISEYARDKFFSPMGLDASFDAKYLSDKTLVANCYEGSQLSHDNKYLTRAQSRGKPGETYHLTAGGLLISAEDLASLYSVLVNDGQYNGQQVLSEKSLKEMLTKQCETKKNFVQCIGIRRKDKLVGERNLYYHNGEAYGIHSLMALDMQDKSGVIVITSGASAARNDNTVFAVCDAVLNYCYENVL